MSGSQKLLWQNRTQYIGNNSAVGNIISALRFPDKVVPDSFSLSTKDRPYAVTINLKTDTETRDYYSGTLHEGPFKEIALIMFALIENADYITFNFDEGVNPDSIQYTSDWADDYMEINLWEKSETIEDFTELLPKISAAVYKETVELIEKFKEQ